MTEQYRYYEFDKETKKWGWVECTKEEMEYRDQRNPMKFPQFRRDHPAPTEEKPYMWSEYNVAVMYYRHWSNTAEQLAWESGWSLADMISFLKKIDNTIGRRPAWKEPVWKRPVSQLGAETRRKLFPL